MSYTKLNPKNGETQVNDTTMKHLDDGIYDIDQNKIDKSTIELLTVDSTAPATCSEGDMYYNTTTNLIYTATGTDTWGTTGETPSSKYLYVDLTNSKLYYYDGATFTSYGGGSSNDVVISPDQPTGDDWKLWIDSDEIPNSGSEITNEYSTSTGLGYSANYVNNINTYSTDEVRVGTWMGKPLYRRAFTGTTSTTSHNYILTNTNDIAKLIGYKGYIEQSNTVQLEIGSSLYHSDGNINTSTRVINVDNNLRLDENYNVFGGKYFEVAVEYTKTTD